MPQFKATRAAFALLLSATLIGCASQPTASPADPAKPSVAAKRDCEEVTGSNVCKRKGAGTVAPVTSVSGETLRATGDGILRDKPSNPSN